MIYYFNKQDLSLITNEDLSPVVFDETHFHSDSGEELVVIFEDKTISSYTNSFNTLEELNIFLDENSNDWSSRGWL